MFVWPTMPPRGSEERLRVWDIVQPLLHIKMHKNTAVVFNLRLVPYPDSSSPDFFPELQALSLHRALHPAQQHWNKLGEFDTCVLEALGLRVSRERKIRLPYGLGKNRASHCVCCLLYGVFSLLCPVISSDHMVLPTVPSTLLPRPRVDFNGLISGHC